MGGYLTPSIKDYEHSQRLESAQLSYTITGSDQTHPSDFAKELKNLNFKQALVDFFILHWASDEVIPFIGNKTIHINSKQCHSFVVNASNNIVTRAVDELSCPEHEEADTKIVYHACCIPNQGNIVIRNVDSDIAAIMLGHMHHLQNDSLIWMLIGTGNKLRFVDLTKIYVKLGESFCKSLPGFHAITGCDYNPAFFRKGKLRPFKIFRKTDEYQKAFIKFGKHELFENDDERQSIFDIIQQFICEVYNVGSIIDIDAARLQLFINTYQVSDINVCHHANPKCYNNFCEPAMCLAFGIMQISKFHQFIKPRIIDGYSKIISTILNGSKVDQLPNFVRDSLKTVSEIDEEEVDDDIEWSNSGEENDNIE